MRNFQDTFETRERPFISGFSISMTVPLMVKTLYKKRKQSLSNSCLTVKITAPKLKKNIKKLIVLGKSGKSLRKNSLGYIEVDFPPANRSQMFFKINVLKNFAKSQEDTCIGVSF